jgi:acetyl-CoA C-acetyltransferase
LAFDEDRIPVIVAVGQSIERAGPVSALDLAERAGAMCLLEAPTLRRRVQQVSVVNIMSGARAAPATALAQRLGLSPASAETTTIGGNSPQWLVGRAAAAVGAGRLDSALVVGAEAQHSIKIGGVSPAAGGESVEGRGDAAGAAASDPDPVVGDDRVGMSPAEMRAGLVAPVHVYALFESVLARRAGHGLAQHRAALGARMARFTQVAASHPYAWFPSARTAGELSTVTADNRLVTEPYPKHMCAFLHVDQGAAVLVTSLAAARAAGVADRAVFCWSAADATEVWFPTARPDPGSSAGLRAAAHAALDAARLGVDDIDCFDVYSCFPCTVEMAEDALGLSPDDARGLTVTGGLPYFGGPGNNYSLHAIATTVDRLRQDGGIGMVSALGWYATKHAVGIYGAAPPPAGWRRGDTEAAQRLIDASAVLVADDADGPAVVVASTVAHGRDGEVRAAPAIARLPDGRQLAAAAEPDELAGLAGRNLVGERVVVTSGQPPRYRVAS